VAHRNCLVEKERPNIKCNTVRPDNIAIFVAEHRRLLVIDFKTDIINATVEEEHFIEFVQFSNQHYSILLAPWLQIPQYTQHEVLVLVIFPCVESWLRLA
jgi:hypothetical protein